MATETKMVGAPLIPVVELERATPRPLNRGALLKSFGVTFFAIVVLAAFLSPMLRTITIALKTPAQISESNAPLWPALPGTFEFEGEELDVYLVPLPDGTTRELAILDPGRRESVFIDPAAPDAEPITWQGSWRALERPWEFSPHWENFSEAWEIIDFPRLLFNTVMLALIGTAGTLLSCVLVAYGFS